MTLIKAIELIRRFTRTTSDGKTDAEITDAINQAQDDFAKEVHDFVKDDYIAIAPKFDTETNFAFNMTITGGADAMAATDVVITTTERAGTTGTIVASDLQATIRTAVGTATPTVAWSTTAWTFTITTAATGTSITLAAPTGITHVNALPLLGLTAETTTGYAITSSIPEDCTVESDLPSDYLELIPPVEWDRNKIYPAKFDIFVSPGYSGTPQYYGIRNGTIRVSPYPVSQKEFHIWYKYIPTKFTQGYQEVGLSAKVGTTATGLTATTGYYFKITIDGGTLTEYTITTGTDVTYNAVITLMNAQVTGAVFALVGGDLRCTSNQIGGTSTIALAAGTTGTNLFATLTGWAAFDTAVAGTGGTDINIDDEDAMAIVYYASSMIAEENYEEKRADRMYVRYSKLKENHIVRRANANTAIFPASEGVSTYEVNI